MSGGLIMVPLFHDAFGADISCCTQPEQRDMQWGPMNRKCPHKEANWGEASCRKTEKHPSCGFLLFFCDAQLTLNFTSNPFLLRFLPPLSFKTNCNFL